MTHMSLPNEFWLTTVHQERFNTQGNQARGASTRPGHSGLGFKWAALDKIFSLQWSIWHESCERKKANADSSPFSNY